MRPHGSFFALGILGVLLVSGLGCTASAASSAASDDPAAGSSGDVPPGSVDPPGAPPATPPAATARCDKTKPFGKPEEISELSDLGADFYNVSSVWLDAAETTMIVTARAGFDDGGKLYTLGRSSPTGTFGAPALVAGVDAASRSEWSGAMSDDGLALYFDVARREPYKATRASASDAWTAGARIAPKLDTQYTSYIDLRPASSGVYFLRQDPSGGSLLSQLANGDDYDKGVLDAAGGAVVGYSLSKDERTLYYSVAPPGIGGNKQYRATRASLAASFGSPKEITLEAIVSSSNGGPRVDWVSEDECVLYAVVGKNDNVGSYPHDVVIRATRP
jgi:hypothetical protein